MALKYVSASKSEANKPGSNGYAEIAAAVQPTKTPVFKKGQAKRLPLDHVRLDMPMRIRTGHMLALFGVSGAQFYKLRKAGVIPEPAGHIGTGKRPAPYWITTEIAKYI